MFARHGRQSSKCVCAAMCSMTAAVLLAGAGRASGQTLYWTGHGQTTNIRERSTVPASPFNYLPLVDLWTADLSGPLANEVMKNLFQPTTAGATSGSYALADLADDGLFNGTIDLVLSNSFSASREMNIGDFSVLRSLQFTTRGDATIRGGLLSNGDWLVRWPETSGKITFDVDRLSVYNLWIGGSGSVELVRGVLTTQTSNPGIFKSGPGTLVLNASSSGQISLDSQFTVFAGDVVFTGPGSQSMVSTFISGDDIRIGREFGGQVDLPVTVPYPGWENIPLSPPAPAPVVHVRRTNVMSGANSVRLGQLGTLMFDASLPAYDFGGVVVSHGAGLGRVVKRGLGSTLTLADVSLDQFTGQIGIEEGTLRTPVPNPGASVVFNSSLGSTDAVLEIQVPSGTQSFQNAYSGLGQLAKSGSGTLNLVDPAPSFTGDYRVIDGTLGTSNTPNTPVLKTGVTVAGGTLLNRASENIDDAASIRLAGGVWNLGGFTETVSQLQIFGNSAVSLNNGTLRLAGNLVALPGPSSTARVNGPGTLVFTGTTARTIDVGNTTASVGLDITAAVSGAPIVITGTGVAQFSGAFTSPSLEVRTGTTRLNIPAAAAKPASITVGYTDPFNPDAPTARLELSASDQVSDTASISLVNRADLDLRGFTDTIGGLTVNGAGPFNVTAGTGELVLQGNASFTGTGTTTISGPLNMLAGSRNFTVNTGATALLTGTAYSGTINKIGPGTLRMDNLDGFFTLNNSGSTTSVGTASVGGVTGNGTVQIDTALTINIPAATQRGYGGVFSGAGTLIKSGAGTQELNAGVPNTYTGGTRVEGGTLFLNRFAGTTVIPGNITVASGGTLLYAGGANNQIADAADVTVETGGVMNLDGQTETVRNLVANGNVTIDQQTGTPGGLSATQTIFVGGGTLTGNVGGGALVVNSGTARVRGTVSSASIGSALTNGTLSVGGFIGADQLTISGTMSLPSTTSTLQFTTGQATDPALIRALGGLTYPFAGPARVRVDQFIPQPIGSAIKLIDFGNGTSTPQLAKYALAAPAAGSGRGVLTLSNRVLSYVVIQNPCPADANGSGTVSVQDIFDYLTAYFSNSPGADFNGSGSVTVQDIFDYLAAYFVGCI